jgi:hypothetical protein
VPNGGFMTIFYSNLPIKGTTRKWIKSIYGERFVLMVKIYLFTEGQYQNNSR